MSDRSGSNPGPARVYQLVAGAWTKHGSEIDGEAAHKFSGQYAGPGAERIVLYTTEQERDASQTDAAHVRVLQQSASTVQITDANICTARDLWFSNELQAIEIYGHITEWNTSAVTNRQYMFC